MTFSSENFARPKLNQTISTAIVVGTESNLDDTADTVRVDFYYDNFDGLGNDKLLFRAILPIQINGSRATIKDVRVLAFDGSADNWATGGQTPADSAASNAGGTGAASPVIGSGPSINLDEFLTAAGVTRTDT